MAIAYLLSLSTINIEAICCVHGLTHVKSGANLIRLLLAEAGKEIPVYEGEEFPVKGTRSFPQVFFNCFFYSYRQVLMS